jgi:hypothetical protein
MVEFAKTDRIRQIPDLVDELIRVAFAATLMAVTGCGMCGEDVMTTQVAPGGKHAITTYVRNCGATTSYVTHANLHLAQRSPFPSWNGAVRSDRRVVLVFGPLLAVILFLQKDARRTGVGAV